MQKPKYNYPKANIHYWAFEFLEKRASPKQLAMVSHMNAFGNSIENVLLGQENPAWNKANKGHFPKQFSKKDVEFLISVILSEVDTKNNQKLEVIHSVERAVRKVLPDLYIFSDAKEIIKLDRDTIDALCVEFINFVGIKVGVDYAMYTKRLREEHPYIYGRSSI